jgi:RNA polymerase sigma-70 factor (ECF subfamily)
MFSFKPPNYKKLADEKLLRAIVNGDAKAFNELYKRYSQRMLYYFYRMLNNDKELAEDFLQDLFFKIIDKPHLFDSSRKFSTWIFSIAYNQCKNEYRSRTVRSIVEKVDNPDCFPQDESNTEELHYQIEDVFDCLNEFDEIHRTAFLFKYREGLSIDEISTILDLPKGTVKSRLFYTRKKIQERLQEKSKLHEQEIKQRNG